MPTHRAQQRARKSGCNYRTVFPQAGDKSCTAKRHGNDEPAYIAGCRCDDAREAHRVGRGRRHLRLIRQGPALLPSIGTVRRLRALAAIGYSVEDIAAGTGIRPSYIGQLQHTTRAVHRRTVEKVCIFYQEHADYRGPSPRAIHYAARNGWLSPLWWDDDAIDDPQFIAGSDSHQSVIDDVAIERWIGGDTSITLTRAEKHAAFYKLRNAGHTVTATARQLGLSGSTARRYETENVREDVLVRQHTPLDNDLEETG